jgi:hypothetical protein
VGEARIPLTLGLLLILTLVFLKGFQEAIGLAAIGIPYLLLNVIVLGRGLIEIMRRPELISNWNGAVAAHGDWTSLLLASAIIFPKLALGMSGFETGVAVMPLVSGDEKGAKRERHKTVHGPIRNTRKLLAAAAGIMSVLLLLSSFVTTVLIPEDAYRVGGPASGRAIAYLAHEMMGHGFGTVYDISTIAILWFAGASAMAGLLHLIPRYMPRFGMAPRWVSFRRPLVLVLFATATAVTLVFKASVEAQGAAYGHRRSGLDVVGSAGRRVDAQAGKVLGTIRILLGGDGRFRLHTDRQRDRETGRRDHRHRFYRGRDRDQFAQPVCPLHRVARRQSFVSRRGFSRTVAAVRG